MIIDLNVYVGNYPFRRLKYNTLDGILKLMDRVGVDKALISRFEAIFYKDWFEANMMLLEELAGSEVSTDRFMPCVIVNPSFPGWIRDLENCLDDAYAIRVHPNYHGYNLQDECFKRLVGAASSREIPIIVTVRVQDERSHPWLMRVPPLDVSAVLKVARENPEVKFVVSNAYLGEVLGMGRRIRECDNLYVELSFASTVTLNSVERLCAEIGSGRVLLGTYMPFFYPDCIVNRVRKAEISEEDKERILWRNAMELLKLSV